MTRFPFLKRGRPTDVAAILLGVVVLLGAVLIVLRVSGYGAHEGGAADSSAPSASVAALPRAAAVRAVVDSVHSGKATAIVGRDPLTAQANQPLEIDGWAFDARAMRPASHAFVQLDRGDMYELGIGIAREDVARVQRSAAIRASGYSGTIPGDRMTPGRHELTFWFQTADGTAVGMIGPLFVNVHA
jgi:hypothetical protein